MTSLSILFDPISDVVTIEGTRYAAALFRSLSILPLSSWVRLLARADGNLTLAAAPPGAVLVGDLQDKVWVDEQGGEFHVRLDLPEIQVLLRSFRFREEADQLRAQIVRGLCP